MNLNCKITVFICYKSVFSLFSAKITVYRVGILGGKAFYRKALKRLAANATKSLTKRH
ncbi:MAG: hypothetical protein RL757_2842 [Bacteroidota bacterium]|jgi:hypothetical protein